ncbi:hypothetical protein [Cylindrospermum sp. FACHB-282]|uniref:hypothetical protein n=1 Tax=Cylindrospermum sp. FACHB-282 TaxID=2692794 RepID=UPI001683A941|nr:hypothetical protein [Cylindrospermum sp. FACHB-282]MBD2386016.1 hypothetical protein [Cylindrospermum sp. FACHB-282]
MEQNQYCPESNTHGIASKQLNNLVTTYSQGFLVFRLDSNSLEKHWKPPELQNEAVYIVCSQIYFVRPTPVGGSNILVIAIAD